MAGQNFGKILLKELQRGGKKSIVLALLLLVGLCIWAPMLWKKVFPKREAPTPAANTNMTSPMPETRGSQSSTSPTPLAATIEWKSLYHRLEKSSLIQPVALDELVRDPFDQEWYREKIKPLAVKPEPQIPMESDPLRNLVLSAILVGAEGSAAVVNDVVYRIGQKIPEEGSIRYILKDIRQDRVVLERSGKLEELRIKDAELATKEPSDQEK